MKQNVLAPSVGESITEVSILKWTKQHGQAVKTGEILLEIESDKATVEVIAESNGTLQILKQQGERVPIGEILGFVDDTVAATIGASAPASTAAPTSPGLRPIIPASAPSAQNIPTAPSSGAVSGASSAMGPAARKILEENHLQSSQVHATGRGGRITKGDALAALAGGGGSAAMSTPSAPVAPMRAATAMQTPAPSSPTQAPQMIDRPGDRRVPMSRIRLKIAERLVHAQHTAAILTTFNEIDMKNLMDLRNKHKDAWKTKHALPMSFMSFFTKACAEALKINQGVNAYIDGQDTIYHDYQDIGIAVGTERGLVVPVLRDAGSLSFFDLDKGINDLANKAKNNKLSIADMTGGTFTISNGGTYGSLLSTPILNPPQSGILGMHKTMDRPIVVDGKLEIRPMMYVALSYDHRIIDGKEAVTFLVTVKDFIENPEKMKLGL